MLEFEESALYLSHVAFGGSKKLFGNCLCRPMRLSTGRDVVLAHGHTKIGLTT